MQREIKFRAWCKDGGPDRKGCMTTLNNEEIDDCLECGDPVMQYTGLHDCKGNEIYEGDILSFNKPDIQLVEWCDKDAMFQLIPGRCGDPLYCSSSIIDFEQAEVIGNIHQHPDLIRKD